MAYLSLHRTISSDLVTPVTALDNNWDQIDSKFSKLDAKASPVGTGATSPSVGMEFVSSQVNPPPVGVWNGTTYVPINVTETWGSWQNITLAANFNAVSGRTPQLRVSNFGKVQCRGAVQYLTGTTNWPTGYQLVNSGQFNSTTYAPSQVCVRNLTATPGTWSYGQGYVGIGSGFLNIYLISMTAPATSNFYIAIDALRWFA
jgi:hypothetical protein